MRSPVCLGVLLLLCSSAALALDDTPTLPSSAARADDPRAPAHPRDGRDAVPPAPAPAGAGAQGGAGGRAGAYAPRRQDGWRDGADGEAGRPAQRREALPAAAAPWQPPRDGGAGARIGRKLP
ncbi:hypothetical protein [Rugamonas rubra]|uniref:Translation initiation factor IF-2 n=1 Tax=Rugamonas rubra TaxID=758825 RepID=A0A1I4USH8_9BURK|nr:hypothetical protein [Rugamonas rubra]SFM91947.1 hypothetical protein SAMN02982985_05789 [Rugamonas rubra]